MACVVLTLLAYLWRPLLLMTLHEDLARVEGVHTVRLRILLLLLLALVVAASIKLVGVLLVSALLVLPASVARMFSHTTSQMAVIAALVGGVAVSGGLWTSSLWDIPAGPSIVLVALLLFILTFIVGRR